MGTHHIDGRGRGPIGAAPVLQKELLHHADIGTTLSIYTHGVSEKKRKASSKEAQALLQVGKWHEFVLSGKRGIGLKFFGLIGGPGEVRTPDPMVANHVLSQLSYRPIVPYNHTGREILIRQAKGVKPSSLHGGRSGRAGFGKANICKLSLRVAAHHQRQKG